MGRARNPPGSNVLDSRAQNYTCDLPASPGGAAWSEKAEASGAPGTPAGAGIWEEKLVTAAVGGDARGVARAPPAAPRPTSHALTSRGEYLGSWPAAGDTTCPAPSRWMSEDSAISRAQPSPLSGVRPLRPPGGEAARIVRRRDRTGPGVRISGPSCTLNRPGTPAIPAPLGPPLDASVHLLCAAQGPGSRCSPQSSCLPSYSAPNLPHPRVSGLLS